MPELTRGTHAMSHTIDSALSCLAALPVPSSRIQVQRMGRSALPDGMVLAQTPRAGTPLAEDMPIRLEVAGLGFTHALPVGMWDSGGEGEPGTWEMLGCVDDPLVKLTHWAHEGASLFRISQTDEAACARWIALFGLRAADLPPDLWFRMATLLPQLHAVACSAEGIHLVLGLLFDLPVSSLSYLSVRAPLRSSLRTRLGERASQLGVDLVMGATVEDLAQLLICLGPVSLALYDKFAEAANGQWLTRTLEYILPAFQDYTLRWLVEDHNRCPQLGIAESNSTLGVNTYFGTSA